MYFTKQETRNGVHCTRRNMVKVTTKPIFNYRGSPGVKILRKVLRGGYFFDSQCRQNGETDQNRLESLL